MGVHHKRLNSRFVYYRRNRSGAAERAVGIRRAVRKIVRSDPVGRTFIERTGCLSTAVNKIPDCRLDIEPAVVRIVVDQIVDLVPRNWIDAAGQLQRRWQVRIQAGPKKGRIHNVPEQRVVKNIAQKIGAISRIQSVG
jgi:hypothetical protein